MVGFFFAFCIQVRIYCIWMPSTQICWWLMQTRWPFWGYGYSVKLFSLTNTVAEGILSPRWFLPDKLNVIQQQRKFCFRKMFT